MKEMMIDYRETNDRNETQFVRKTIDNNEFCIREGIAYFISEGIKVQVPLQNISQVYTI